MKDDSIIQPVQDIFRDEDVVRGTIGWIVVASAGQMRLFARRYDETTEILHKAIEADPDSVPAHDLLGEVYVGKGMCKESIEEFTRRDELNGQAADAQAPRQSFAEAGCQGAFRRRLERDKERAKREYLAAGRLAYDCMQLGDKEGALQYLEKAYQERDAVMLYLAVDPLFDPLRSDPRFQDFLRRMNLPTLDLTVPH
jgi:tetratricopeptide (TPR) repeat protein